MVETPPGWKPIHAAPAETDLCICIKDGFGLYPLPFPCRRRSKGWVKARQPDVPLDIAPLGWREWHTRHKSKTWLE